MARPKQAETMSAISVRLPKSMIAEVDECAERLEEETPLFSISRTDAIRCLLQIGLAEFEKRGLRKK